MNLRQIDYAIAVAETQNFTRAAERCHTVQSALSHQIAKLEATLGCKLFERTSRQVLLTAAGQTFLTHAYAVQAACAHLRQEMAAALGEIRGSLSIGTISTLSCVDLPALLAQYHRRYPAVDIRLCHGMSDRMQQEMRALQLDVAFLGVWPGDPLEGLDARLLKREPLVALMAASHSLAGQPVLALRQLSQCALVDYAAGSAAREQTDRAFMAAGLTHTVKFEINHGDLLAGIVRQGLAIGLVPRDHLVDVQGLVQIPVLDAPQRHVYFACSPHPTPAAAAFQQLVLAACPALSPADPAGRRDV